LYLRMSGRQSPGGRLPDPAAPAGHFAINTRMGARARQDAPYQFA